MKIKKLVLGLAVVIGINGICLLSYSLGFRRGKVQGESDHIRFGILFNTDTYYALKSIETEDLSKTSVWNHVLMNLQTKLDSDLLFMDSYPAYFKKDMERHSFESRVHGAREATKDLSYVSMIDIVESVMGTTNLVVEKKGANTILFKRGGGDGGQNY